MKRKERKPEGTASPDIRKELEKLKPTFSMEIDLSPIKGGPQAKVDAAQAIAEKVNSKALAEYPDAVAGFSVGHSGRTWSISTQDGRIRVSYKDGEKVKVDFFRFGQDSELVKAVRESLKGL